MPIFEFVCKSCDRRFEALVSGSAEPSCPACSGRELSRQLSVFAVGRAGPGPRPMSTPGPCGTCGDPRGPGSCALD